MSEKVSGIKFEIFYGVSSPWAYYGAPQIESLISKYNIIPTLRPIIIVQENGGIPLRMRPDARQSYHALELSRWSKRLGMPLKLRPKWYPLAPGLIEIPAQAIIRAQHRYGSGAKIVRDFSFAIQQTLWAREGHIGSPSVLVNCAVEVGIPRDVALLICQDKREDDNDPAVKEWKGNLEEAEALGIFGTPNYVINGEIFWGQDRLSFVAERLEELLADRK